MSFKVYKCKVIHIGDKNSRFKYYIGDQELDNVIQEKNRGIIRKYPKVSESVYCDKQNSN